MKPISDSRLIVALDTHTRQEAQNLTEELGDTVNFYKIGLRLIADGGVDLAGRLKMSGKKIFLDLKLFDTAKTVETATQALVRRYPPIDMITVHGDPQVVTAAIEGRGNADTKILAVTLLTSLDREDLDQMLITKGNLAEIARSRAARAFAAGADGVIASPLEIEMLRKLPACKDKLIVTPGIRPAEAKPDDQKRHATPAEAIRLGANHIVVGRPILWAHEPVEAAQKILDEIRHIPHNPEPST